MKFSIPIRLPSLSNTRLHWRAMDALKKRQKLATHTAMLKAIEAADEWPLEMPLTVVIARVGMRMLDDDNLAAACKYVRDQIAAEVGVDDGSPLYTWKYRQRKGKYAVEVEITGRCNNEF